MQIETSYHSYPSIFALGHRVLVDLLLDDVTIEEKVDGSQFSFGLFEDGLHCRSKGKEIILDAPEKMFQKAIETIQKLDLHLGWTYRTEFLAKPKHNTLCYERVPANHLIVFDINTGQECYLDYAAKAEECKRIGLECVPLVFQGRLTDTGMLANMLDRTSILGDKKIEGIVIKNYTRFGPDKKCLMAKVVCDEFKEKHQGEWKKANPGNSDVIEALVLGLRTTARFQKAVQHMRENGTLVGEPRDIGGLIKEVQEDIQKECLDEITTALLRYALPKVLRGVVAGLPEWYKSELLANQPLGLQAREPM